MAKRFRKPPVEAKKRHEWLRRYEEDEESPPQIAKSDGFDVRTVRTQIKKAEEEREMREAKVQVFRKAMESHYADLCGFVERLKTEIARENAVSLLLRDDPMLSALRQHLSRSPIWKYLGRWDDLLKEIDNKQKAINIRLENEVGANEKLNSTLSGDCAIAVRRGIVAALNFQAKQWSRREKDLDINEDFKEEPAEKSYVNLRYGFAQMGKVEKKFTVIIREAIISFGSQIRHWDEYNSLQKLYAELQLLKSKLQDELAVIIYRRIVPGRCKYCPL
jgi:hypothetical protein